MGGLIAATAEEESNDAALDDIVILQDPDVIPPVAKPERMENVGRITVNLHADGAVTGEGNAALETDEAIKGYLERRKEEIAESGKKPRLFLRGDQGSVFESARRVIRIAAEAGVDRVIFAVHFTARKDDMLIEPRDTDVRNVLPEKQEPKNEIVVRVEKGGRIILETEEVELDTDPKDQELPLFRAALKKAKAEGEGLGLKLRIEKDVEQGRVIAVLNACAAEGISIVTFLKVE